jgi:hypothetical protein
MKKTLWLFALMLVLSACGNKQNLPIIDATLIGVKGITQAVNVREVQQKDLVGCYVTAAIITGLDSAQLTVDTWTQGEQKTGVIPMVNVDISACNALLEEPLKPIIPEKAEFQVRETVGALEPLVFAGLEALVGIAELDCRNRVIADGTLQYIRGSIQPVIDELIKPDGIMTIPAVTLDMKDCKEGMPMPSEKASTPAPAPCECPKCPAS